MKHAWILLLALLAGCAGPTPTKEAPDEHAGEEQASEEAEAHVELTEEQINILGIKTATVNRLSVRSEIKVPGVVSVATKGRAVVTPLANGRVVSLHVELGDQVRAGQNLATIESSELAEAWERITEAQRARGEAESGVTDARAQVAIASGRLASAEQTLKRQRQFAASGAFSQAAIEAARSTYNEAQSELLSLKGELATHAEQLRRMERLFQDGLVSRIELEDARLDVHQDQIKLEAAESRVSIARVTLEREDKIAAQGLSNAREVQTAEAEVNSARLELQRAQAAERSARAYLTSAARAIANAQTTYQAYAGGGRASAGRVVVKAPISGTIAVLAASRGQAVDRTHAMFEIENLNAVWITAKVPEKDSTVVAVGQSVRIVATAIPNVEFEGVVQVVGNRLDEKTRTLPVQCLVSNIGGRLKSEMFADVFLASQDAVEGIFVPKTAVTTEARKSYVWVTEGDHFERVEVAIGKTSGQRIEIIEGLDDGAEVVTEGVFGLNSELAKGELKGHDH